jgi:hypothetical protein
MKLNDFSVVWALIGAIIGGIIAGLLRAYVGIIGVAIVGFIVARLVGKFGQPTRLSTYQKILLVIGLLLAGGIVVIGFQILVSVIGEMIGTEETSRMIGPAIGVGVFIGAIVGGTRGSKS